jgi:hypothetical protein
MNTESVGVSRQIEADELHPSGERSSQDNRKKTPGASGHPEPGSGHDDSKTVTVEDGPPIKKVGGVPGAFGNSTNVEGPVSDHLDKPGTDSR